jgi:tetratricopeptide (TPR) repeat protein
VLVFAVVLASFPARNPDVWLHLAGGRDLAHAATGPGDTWLYDLASYTLYSAFGGAGLVGVKALLCGVVAVILLRLGDQGRGWMIPLAVTTLAVLAMSNRLLLQPATASVFFLAVALLVSRGRPPGDSGSWPGWRLVVLLVVWANVDRLVVLGLGAVALSWLGEWFDARPPRAPDRGARRWAVSVAILAVAAAISPSHLRTFQIPPELRSAAAALWRGEASENRALNSPFEQSYFDHFRDSPAALAYYPLLALGLLSFVLNRAGWRWSRFLPWLALAAASSVQARFVPLFAVVAGPATALNLQDFFARRGSSAAASRNARFAAVGLTATLSVAFLALAWSGWLHRSPFEPRRWAVETPAALPTAAEFIRQTHRAALWAEQTRTLHASAGTAASFAWFCPEDRGLVDEAAVEQLIVPDQAEAARDRLRALGVSRVVAYAGDADPASDQLINSLLSDPGEWPVLHLTGGVVVFGWRDPERPAGPDRLRSFEVDFDRIAYRPTEAELAPGAGPAGRRRWWEAFWKPAPPPRPPGRDEAEVLLAKAEALARAAPPLHLAAWEAGQAAALAGAAGGWVGPEIAADVWTRLGLLSPPVPDDGRLPDVTQLVFLLHQEFAASRGHAPVGLVYAAIRAARRGVVENPGDANAYLTLGRAYGVLVNLTSERLWTSRNPQLMKLRQVQASAAFNRAAQLNPKLARAHLELARLYPSLGSLDLAAFHLKTYLESPPHRGGPRTGSREAESLANDLSLMSKQVERESRAHAEEGPRLSVSDRAVSALRRGLGGEARDLLLKSDIAAFGSVGMELELDLLLRTGRPETVLEWTSPEARATLGEFAYHWLRAQAHLALGNYDAADEELSGAIGPRGRMPDWEPVAREVAGLVGKAVLDDELGGTYLPQLALAAFNRAGLRDRVGDISEKLSLTAEVTMLRGLAALEAGRVDRAGSYFRAALDFSPDVWGGGQLDFAGRHVARQCLALLGDDANAARAGRPAR